MPASSIEEFHHWRAVCHDSLGPAIAVQVAPGFEGDVPALLSRYLNEYDETAAGRWTPFDPGTVEVISRSAMERGLLDVVHECPQCPAGSVCLQKKICKAIAGLGFAILEGSVALEATRDLKNVFRIAIGVVPASAAEVHLLIQPREFDAQYLPVLAGDAFLEWSTARGLAQER